MIVIDLTEVDPVAVDVWTYEFMEKEIRDFAFQPPRECTASEIAKA